MSAEPINTPDPDQDTALRALALLANIVMLLVLATYFFGCYGAGHRRALRRLHHARRGRLPVSPVHRV